ncbi:LOW QUALITY PROTEIN: coiled-coil domain-containing protein 150 [Porphyrio hochstetteri]
MPWRPACRACAAAVPCPRFWTAAGLGAHAGSAAGEQVGLKGTQRRGEGRLGAAPGATMARPTIIPTSVRATAPEAFMVLHWRMRVVEEEASALVRDLEALGIDGQSLSHFHSKTSETAAGHPAISPVQARVAFVGENTLWKNCETLVKMCRLESVVQTLKLNIFQLQAEKELNPKHAAQLERHLNAIHEEHLQEMKIVQQEAMKLHQHLSDMKKAEEKAKEEVQRLNTALEMTNASKMDVMIAAEELRNANQKMNCRLQELTEQLSQEISLRESLEESQTTVMSHVQDMETRVEAERKQVQILEKDCQELRRDVHLAQVKLQEEEERTAQLEHQCTQLEAELDSRNRIISQLSEEAKNAQLSFSKQCKENLQLQSKVTTLQETAEKVQVLNNHLSQQCSELSTTLQSLAMENAKLISDHQTMLKAEQENTHKLQEQDLLLNATHANVFREVQSVQRERAQLQRELEALRREHGRYREEASLAEAAATTQKQLLECTITRLQGELETALQEKGSLLAEKEGLQQEIRTTVNEILQERNRSEVEKSDSELEMVSMKFTLQALEEENKRLSGHLTALAHKQYAQQQVQQVLAELADSKNRLACDKGKLQMANLQHQLDAAKDGNSKATATLELMLAFHNKMQAALDAVQTELGHKETEISSLQRDKSHAQKKIQRLETELEDCQAKLITLGRQHSSQVESLCKALESARTDKKLIHCLEEVLQISNTLQSKLIQTQHELRRKEAEHQQLKVCRKLLMEKAKTEEKKYSEHLESLRKQFQTEQEVSRKSACQESAKVEKSLDEYSSKLAEAPSASRELQQKETESELKAEAIRDECQNMNSELSQDIQKFVSELKSVQSEMPVVLKKQHEVQVQNRLLEIQLETERRQRQQLENECQELEKTAKHLKKYEEETEKKLKEASRESEQITTSLEAAHCWFKSGSLQQEVLKHQQSKNPQERSSKMEVKKSSTVIKREAKKIGGRSIW